MNAHLDGGGASLQPDLPDDLSFFRGCVTGACISLAMWIAIGAGVYAWFVG